MKEGMNRYATKNRLQQKGYFFKYSDGSSGRKARQASRSDSLQQSRKEPEEVNPGLSLDLQEIVAKDIEWYGKVVLLSEEVVPKVLENSEQNSVKTKKKSSKKRNKE